MSFEDIPPNTRIIVVRRGSNMRLLFPVDPVALYSIMPPELAEQAIRGFLDLQSGNPGRADMPINMTTAMGLVIRESEYVLDPESNVAVQLEGRWQDMTVQVVRETGDDTSPYQQFPCTLLNLDDIEDAWRLTNG